MGCCTAEYVLADSTKVVIQMDIPVTSTLRGALGALAALAFTSTVWLAATPAAADDYDTCGKASGNEAIAACTRAIDSGQYSGRQLAALFNNRCSEWNGKQESGQGLCRLRRSDPALSKLCIGILQPRQRLLCKRPIRPRHRGTNRSSLIPATQMRSATAATPTLPKANTTAPSRITTKRSGLIRNTQLRSTTAAPPITPKANPTAPSRITAKRSGLIRTTQMRSTTVATPITPKANSTAPSRISTKRSGLIRTTQRRSTTAAPPITAKANTIEPSRISTKRSASIRTWR